MGKTARFSSLPPRPGDELKTVASIEKARHLLGYAPDTDFRDGLVAEVNWFLDLS